LAVGLAKIDIDFLLGSRLGYKKKLFYFAQQISLNLLALNISRTRFPVCFLAFDKLC